MPYNVIRHALQCDGREIRNDYFRTVIKGHRFRSLVLFLKILVDAIIKTIATFNFEIHYQKVEQAIMCSDTCHSNKLVVAEWLQIFPIIFLVVRDQMTTKIKKFIEPSSGYRSCKSVRTDTKQIS